MEGPGPSLALLQTPCVCRVAWVQPTVAGVGKMHPQDTELRLAFELLHATPILTLLCSPTNTPGGVTTYDWEALTGRQEMDRFHSMTTTQREGHTQDTCVCWRYILAQAPG